MRWVCFMACWHLILACFIVAIRGMRQDEVVFTTEPADSVYIQNNRSFLVPCQAEGKKPLRIYWRNESVLTTNVEINTTAQGLWFPNGAKRALSSKRVGIFRCIASSATGAVIMSKKFELNFIYLRSVFVNLSGPALFGNVVRLKCHVDSNQPVKYSWYKNNKHLNVSLEDRLEALPSGVLQIRDYRMSDGGTYVCQAENDYKSITSQGLKIIGQSALNTSIHIYPGKIIHTTVGSPLVIECIQYSPQKSSVFWSKVTELGTKKLGNGAGYVNLVFHSVKQSDAGEYRCLATDGVEQVVYVSVEAPPSFTEKLPARTRHEEGKKLIFTCRASGSPTPSVTWYKDGQVLVEDHHVRFRENNLELGRVALKDCGMYQCEVENKHGSIIDQTYLSVEERMDPPYNVQVFALSTTTVNVTWQIPSGYRSIFIVVHFFDYMRKTHFSILSEGCETHLVVRQLKPYTNYAIYVKLWSENKERGRSKTILVRTLETKPSGPPSVVKLTSYSYGTLDVMWLPPLIMHRNGKITGYVIKYSKQGNNEEIKRTIGKASYTTTLAQLLEGKKYKVKIAAKTKAGTGPFEEFSVVISRKSDGTVIPPPALAVKNGNASIMVNVRPPANEDVRGYQLKYWLLGDHMREGEKVIKKEKEFEYGLKKMETNVEYVISVAAFRNEKSFGRPEIVVVPTEENPVMINHTMFTYNFTELPRLKISCKPGNNSLAVRWEKISSLFVPEYEAKYWLVAAEKSRTVITKNTNMTIADVSPGEVYTVQVKAIFRNHPVSLYSTSSRAEIKLCEVPEKRPGTPPREISCNTTKSSVIVKWQEPSQPNGEIVEYLVQWLGVGKKTIMSHVPTSKNVLEIENFQRNPNFTVIIFAVNSAGRSDVGVCTVDTSKIEVLQPGGSDNGSTGSGDDADIEKGIVIGCIISVLLLFVLVMFVCWSGCRKRKPAQSKDGESSGPQYYNVRNSRSHPDTVSTEVSEISSKHHAILKRFIDEETSKESDRGVGLTPKSSRLNLDCEKLPFLPRAASGQGESADTSCDSQDSGVQGFGSKSSTATGQLKDPDKRLLQRPENSVAETVF